MLFTIRVVRVIILERNPQYANDTKRIERRHKMNKLFFPSIFHVEDIGFSVSVPDIDGCFTEGDTMEEAYLNTVEAIGLYFEEIYENKMDIPSISAANNIRCREGEFIVFIEFDVLAYRKKHENKAIKKTLTIPSWLNTLAEEQQINFSKVLQTALKEKLHIQ